MKWLATSSVWRERVEAWTRSGLSCKRYAAKIGVNPHTLAGWRWKLRRQTAATASTRARAPVAGLVDVTKQVAAALATEVGVIEVELGGALVRVRGEVDAEVLVRLLSALGGHR
ncbi:IS66 family insertion sequence element accessory protein TnpA [Nannocystis pusilla]|uniref:IS66 family insertion sequence element accessory protein TnpA n=1 Tax=Nannocystis pusilla TaxID=889268 RepID=UPI003B780DAD